MDPLTDFLSAFLIERRITLNAQDIYAERSCKRSDRAV